MIALLAEQAADSSAVPAWVPVVVGLLSVVGGASWPRVQAWARGAKKVVASAESILDLVDGEDPPEERRATFSAFLAAHGRDPEFLAALAAKGFRPPPVQPWDSGPTTPVEKPPEVKP